jgi:excisionase family DNA binding protein
MPRQRQVVESPMLTVREAAEYLRINTTTMRAIINAGLIPTFDLGWTKISRPALDNFINKWSGKSDELKSLIDDKPAKPDEKKIYL